jgi:hypothetical protein
MKRALLIMVLVPSACGHKDPNSPAPKLGASTCDALLIHSLEARALRDQVTAQFASTSHALERADELQKKTLPPEEVGTDDYNGAMQRAFAYKRTGAAICQAALFADQGMLELARRSLDAGDVGSAEDQLTRVTCRLKSQVDGGPDLRRAALAEWSSQSRDALEFEDRLVQACYDKSGGARPEFHLTPPLLPSE